jgi:hypothetical protein
VKNSLIFFLNAKGLGFIIIMLMSLANKAGLDLSDIILERSLIYRRKTKGRVSNPEEPNVSLAAIQKDIHLSYQYLLILFDTYLVTKI